MKEGVKISNKEQGMKNIEVMRPKGPDGQSSLGALTVHCLLLTAFSACSVYSVRDISN
jgi:hypothetical protein